MRLEVLHAHWFCRSISLLLSGVSALDLDKPIVPDVPRDVMLNVYVSRTPAAKPIMGHLDDPFVILLYCDFAVDGGHHKFLYLPQKAELIDYFGKRDAFRLGCSSCCHPLCPGEPADCPFFQHDGGPGDRSLRIRACRVIYVCASR